MKKHELLQSGDSIIRVLEIQEKILIIDCVKQTMPVWVEPSALGLFSSWAGAFTAGDVGTLDADQRKTMYDRLYHDVERKVL